MPNLNLVKVRALVAFTEPTAKGMVHGDPDNSDDEAKFPLVPEESIEKLVREGKIEVVPEGIVAKTRPPARAATPTKTKPEDAGKALDGFTTGRFAIMAGSGIGMYAIIGPGLDEAVNVKGKVKAQAKLDELNAAAPAGGDDESPPVD